MCLIRSAAYFFSNEFFDALPVEAVLFLGGEFRRRFVAWKEGRFFSTEGDLASRELAGYFRRFFLAPAEGNCYEVNLEALNWIGRISRALGSGWVLSIDYGYTRAEAVRFARGTLMSDRPPHGRRRRAGRARRARHHRPRQFHCSCRVRGGVRYAHGSLRDTCRNLDCRRRGGIRTESGRAPMLLRNFGDALS